ncbi:MAG: hypothetical protein M1418_06015, partial [Deltaproteobacteria bacterium]|nr:hypothetical protein [Deltaproteobacteria bacterium]
MKRTIVAMAAVLGLILTSAALAGTNHADFITGPFKSGPEVTAKFHRASWAHHGAAPTIDAALLKYIYLAI